MAEERQKLTPKGEKQASIVMREFYKKNLRSKSGETVTDINQAKAIAMEEGRTGEAQGTAKRTWEGRSRIRPKLK